MLNLPLLFPLPVLALLSALIVLGVYGAKIGDTHATDYRRFIVLAVAASLLAAPQPGPNNTVIFHVQHHWVTESGDNIFFDPAVATTAPLSQTRFAFISYPTHIIGGTGKFAGATGNLDNKTGVEIMGLFARLHEGGNTIILVTHEPDVAAYAHRVIHIRDGKVEKDVAREQPVATV